eukprot:2950301-Pleurochrysis_carterae.AAC.3
MACTITASPADNHHRLPTRTTLARSPPPVHESDLHAHRLTCMRARPAPTAFPVHEWPACSQVTTFPERARPANSRPPLHANQLHAYHLALHPHDPARPLP